MLDNIAAQWVLYGDVTHCIWIALQAHSIRVALQFGWVKSKRDVDRYNTYVRAMVSSNG